MITTPIAVDDELVVLAGGDQKSFTGSLNTNDTLSTNATAWGWSVPMTTGSEMNGAFWYNGTLKWWYIQQSGYVTAVFETDVTAIKTDAGGTVWLQSNGAYTYTPPVGYYGPDSFEYAIYDNNWASSTATVYITVDPAPGANFAPDTNPDVFQVLIPAGQKYTSPVSVLKNDLDGADDSTDDDALTVVGTTFVTAKGGIVSMLPSGIFTYTPKAGFVGDDTFMYTAVDGRGAKTTETVTLKVGLGNSAPIVNGESFTAAHDKQIKGLLLENDSDPDNNTLSTPAGTYETFGGGKIVITSDGQFTYTPPANKEGTDKFTYTVNDGQGGSGTGTVNFTLTNAAPVAADDEIRLVAGETPALSVLGNDNDPDGDELTVDAGEIVSAQGVIVVMHSNGTFTYKPGAELTEADTFAYTVRDNANGVSTGTVTILPNSSPTAATNVFETPHGTTLHGNVLVNAVDPEGDDIWATPETRITTLGYSITIQTDGSFTYEAPASELVKDSFTYEINDSHGGKTTATASITSTNAAPEAVDEEVTIAFGQSARGNVLTNATDPEGDAMTAIEVLPTAMKKTVGGGLFTLQKDGAYLYTPPLGFSGTDTVTFSITDSLGAVSTAQLKIIVLPKGNPIYGTSRDDTLSGTASDDTMYGREGKDTLNGLEGNDMLLGEAGDDTLYGGAGEDVLDGGAGTDKSYGGAGNDLFVVRETVGTSLDKIMDWKKGDKLGVVGSDFGLTAGAQLGASQFASTASGPVADVANGRLLYNQGNKTLYWDADGKASTANAVLTTFASKVALSADDFSIV
jgi:Ca2+-binding RTX toxin-like protein